MEIEIIVFKNSGKYYTSDTVKSELDIWLFKDEFRQFVKDNLPAKIGEGFVTVRDTRDNQSFHIALYRYDELFG
jgi:hypothetical protein